MTTEHRDEASRLDREYEAVAARYTPITVVKPSSPRWFWRKRIVRGDLNILAGTQGVGKSQIAMAIVAETTQHDETTLLISAEDTPSTTIAPRFIAANGKREDGTGVPLLHIRRLESHAFQLDDLDELREDIATLSASLVVIDPVAAFVGHKTDTYKDAHVRALLAPLRRIAEELDCTILLLMHLKKGQEAEFVNKVGGSIAWTAAPRSVLVAQRVQEIDTGDHRLLFHPKCNVGMEQPTLEYTIVNVDKGVYGNFETSYVEWGDEVDLDPTFATSSKRASKLGECIAWLREELEDGPVPSDDLDAHAKDIGYAGVLKRARKKAGIVARQHDDGRWYAHIPS